jgi:hypothetical protein
MRVFQSTYVGRHDFPKSLPDFLLQQWFTLNDRDRRAIRKAFRSRHWIGAALQLGFVGMTGTTLRSLEYVPAAVLRHLGRQFKQPVPDIATLRTLYRRRRTRFEHQRWAIKQWGLREFDPAIEQRLTEHVPVPALTRLYLGVGWSRPRASGCIGPTWPFRGVVRLRCLFAASFNPLRSKIIAICGDT